MSTSSRWPEPVLREVFRERLAQPDRRSCGAATLVVARMLVDDGYRALLLTGRHPRTGFVLPGGPAERFGHEVLAMHRRVTGPVDATGRLQVPWPRPVGTPPWAVAHQLAATSGPGVPRVPHTVRPALRFGAGLHERVRAATAAGRPVAAYVGDRWLPRHVVLLLGEVEDRVRCYEPAAGRLVEVEHGAFARGDLGLAGWDRPWFLVLPA